MLRSRALLQGLLGGIAFLAAAPLAAVEWTLIDVKARLDGDGRLHVAETHRLRLERGGGFNMTREFGLGADQSILLEALTRIDPNGRELPLAEGVVDRPDLYRYYERGHAYFAIPDLPEGAEVAYRFDYEVAAAIAPAWGIGTGLEPLTADLQLVNPWPRARALLDDWREAWPDPRRLFRLEHEVLFPSRDGPGLVVRRIDYRLDLDPAWRRVHPEAELVLQFRSSRVEDSPIVAVANLVPLVVARSWPRGWWHEGRPSGGLLLPLAALTVGFLALQLGLNRPLPWAAWAGGALVVLAAHAAVLLGSRMPTGGRHDQRRDLDRIRRFAATELRRARPHLEDSWISRLQALGLGPGLDRWQNRHGGAAHSVPDLSEAEVIAGGPVFTGRGPQPFAGPPGWADELYIGSEEDE